jgi:acetolactate synthase-1/2/3 large subunit
MSAAPAEPAPRIEGHGGDLAVAVARAHGVETMFTLSGAHVFPLYDGAVKAEPPMRLVDVRHEQSAVFAAEATAKLTRRPGLAVLTAGPGVTNGVSAVTSAWFNGSPLLVLGGRAPAFRWGTGSLQELDHPPLLRPVTKNAATVGQVAELPGAVDEALRLATMPHRGPVFLDVPMDQLFSRAEAELPPAPSRVRFAPDEDAVRTVGRLLAEAQRPVLVLGGDVWADGAEGRRPAAGGDVGVPVGHQRHGQGRGPGRPPAAGHQGPGRGARRGRPRRRRRHPLDFRLGYGAFGGRDGAPAARVVHLTDSPGQLAGHVPLAGAAAGDLTAVLDGVTTAWEAASARSAPYADWLSTLQDAVRATAERDAALLCAEADPIHPARIYGELIRLLDDDAVVIGDGGDFVSFAGKYVEPKRPGCWLDPGPYGCLGTGLGSAVAARIARPSSQVVLLLGDGAAGFSLLDVDTLVRHRLPVVMVVGNNSAWGLEKHPMRFLYGYDVAAELAPQTRYDEVVRALGGAGELVTRPGDIGPALRRAFDSGVPYLVNVVTDSEVAYPRTTTGV